MIILIMEMIFKNNATLNKMGIGLNVYFATGIITIGLVA